MDVSTADSAFSATLGTSDRTQLSLTKTQDTHFPAPQNEIEPSSGSQIVKNGVSKDTHQLPSSGLTSQSFEVYV